LLVGEARRAKMESYRKSRVVSDRKDKQADQRLSFLSKESYQYGFAGGKSQGAIKNPPPFLTGDRRQLLKVSYKTIDCHD